MPLPDDPRAFLAAAQRGINERDLAATVGVYAVGARLESLTDGALERFDGADEIRAAWAGYLRVIGDRDLRLRKELSAVSGDTLANVWTGSLGGRTDAQGMEYWRFDADGRVFAHRMYSFLNLKPSSHPLARLRLGLAYPRTALAFLRAQRADHQA